MDTSKPIWATADGVYLRITVVPRAKRDEIIGLVGDSLKIRLKAPPIEGQANEALVAFVASRLGLPRSAPQFVSGATTRRKILFIPGLSSEEVMQRLQLS